MAVKKGGKSSKTAHILNVLSGDMSEGIEETTGGGTETAGEGAPAVSDETLAAAIRESLAEDMRREEGDALEAPAQEPSGPQRSPVPATETSEVEENTAPSNTAQEEKTVPPETAPTKVQEVPAADAQEEEAELPPPAPSAQEPAREAESSDKDRNFCYVNVMETLVEEKAPKYINMFGVCSCARCVSDVKALALSNLPPKYAVMEKGRVIPMLTVYEGRFSTALTSQIISACKQVMLEPRH